VVVARGMMVFLGVMVVLVALSVMMVLIARLAGVPLTPHRQPHHLRHQLPPNKPTTSILVAELICFLIGIAPTTLNTVSQ